MRGSTVAIAFYPQYRANILYILHIYFVFVRYRISVIVTFVVVIYFILFYLSLSWCELEDLC